MLRSHCRCIYVYSQMRGHAGRERERESGRKDVVTRHAWTDRPSARWVTDATGRISTTIYPRIVCLCIMCVRVCMCVLARPYSRFSRSHMYVTDIRIGECSCTLYLRCLLSRSAFSRIRANIHKLGLPGHLSIKCCSEYERVFVLHLIT